MIPEFKLFLEQENAYDIWKRIFLGANLVKLIRDMISYKSIGKNFERLKERLLIMIEIMDFTDINRDKIESILKFI